MGFRFFSLVGGSTLLLNNEPYVNIATCVRVAYMMHIYLIYQPTISTSKLEKILTKKSTIMEAYFLYLLGLSSAEQYKPAQKQQFKSKFYISGNKRSLFIRWQFFQQILATEL